MGIFETIKSGIAKLQPGEIDIIKVIEEDHLPLKHLIKIMKDSESYDIAERRLAFMEFAPLLTAHAKPEEEVLYTVMKKSEAVREDALEGETEHVLAEQMVEEAMRSTDDDEMFSAKIKVLAELVEHHIKEEENDLLPDFKNASDEKQRRDLGNEFLKRKLDWLAVGGEDAPSEPEIETEDAVFRDDVRH